MSLKMLEDESREAEDKVRWSQQLRCVGSTFQDVIHPRLRIRERHVIYRFEHAGQISRSGKFTNYSKL